MAGNNKPKLASTQVQALWPWHYHCQDARQYMWHGFSCYWKIDLRWGEGRNQARETFLEKDADGDFAGEGLTQKE